MKPGKFLFPVILVLLWLVMITIVNPLGNFPLDDDWQYARPVWFLINKGYYLSTDQFSPIILAQVLWGSLFCLPGGFSFTALRISTLVLSLIGIVVFYFLLLRLSKNEKLSFLGAFLLMANPLYIAMSNSFMTDVPFLSFSIISIYFFIFSMDSPKVRYIIFGTLFAILATLIRQYGLVIPVAYALTSIIKNRPKLMQWGKYILPAIITLVVLKLSLLWLKHIGSELKPYEGSHVVDFLKKPGDISAYSLERGSYILLYGGFFLFPLLTYTTWQTLLRITRRQKIAIYSVILLLVPVLIIWCHQLPYGNILTTYGIGAETLKGMNTRINPNPDFPPILLKILKTIAFTGAIMLLVTIGKVLIDILQAFIDKSFSNILLKQIFVLLFFLGYALMIFIPNFFFDRYLIPFFSLSVIIIIADINKNITIKLPLYLTYCSLVLLMGLAGSALTHDYLGWNNARWQGTDYLTKNLKVSPHKIDGGYEFNGWMIGNYFPDNPQNPNRSKWFVDDDEYVVTFGNIDGYSIITQYPYQNYFPYETRNICILQRK
jgi:hypothetical protein